MKKILSLFLFTLLYSLPSIAQQISTVADFQLPAGAVRIDAKQLKNYDPNAEPDTGKTVYYAASGIQMGFLDVQTSRSFHRSLENQVTVLLAVGKINGYQNAKADIRNFNGTRFIVFSYDSGGVSYIRFYSDYHKNSTITGVLLFDFTDNDKATGMLNDVLNSVVFKN